MLMWRYHGKAGWRGEVRLTPGNLGSDGAPDAGGMTRAKDEHRGALGLPSIDSLLQALRYAVNGWYSADSLTSARSFCRASRSISLSTPVWTRCATGEIRSRKRAARSKEFAMYGLGCRTWTMVSQWLTESFVLSGAGALLGLAFAYACLAGFVWFVRWVSESFLPHKFVLTLTLAIVALDSLRCGLSAVIAAISLSDLHCTVTRTIVAIQMERSCYSRHEFSSRHIHGYLPNVSYLEDARRHLTRRRWICLSPHAN